MAGQGPIPTRAPRIRRISARSAVIALDGPERPYPVYRLPRVHKWERPKHNPFQGL